MAKTLSIELQVQLTPEESHMKALELAKVLTDIDAVEEERRAATSRLGEQAKKLRERVAKVRLELLRGEEARLVDCVEKPNLDRRAMDLVRQDTGEIVSARPMTNEEINDAKQLALELGLADVANAAERGERIAKGDEKPPEPPKADDDKPPEPTAPAKLDDDGKPKE